MFLGKTLHSPHASLHPGVQMGTGELLGKPDEMLRGGGGGGGPLGGVGSPPGGSGGWAG